MSDHIKHECGIALIRLLKPLEYYQKKYGTKSYGVNKMYLMMEKQHNRGQDGAGLATVKINAKPGEKYIFRERSSAKQPIQEIFSRISERIQASDSNQNNTPFQGELLLGHVRYGTFGKNNIESVHPFLRQNNWTHRNLIVAGNFNMTNNDELFENLVKLGQHPKSKVDSVTVMEKIGHFLDDAVHKIYRDLKKEGYNKQEASPLIEKRLKISKIKVLDKKHISNLFISKEGFSVMSICFNSVNEKIGKYLLNYKKEVNVIGYVKENFWNNKKTLQLVIRDLII